MVVTTGKGEPLASSGEREKGSEMQKSPFMEKQAPLVSISFIAKPGCILTIRHRCADGLAEEGGLGTWGWVGGDVQASQGREVPDGPV